MSILSQIMATLTRQQKAALVVFAFTILVVFIAFDAGLLYVFAHGWQSFVDRGAGTGATPGN